MKKAVIFDLDGTLIDSLEDLADATNHTLQAYNMPTHPVDAYRYYLGDGMDLLIKRAAVSGTDADLLKEMTRHTAHYYSTHWAVKTKPYKGIQNLLNSLEILKIPMAILTNKRDDFAKEIVKYFFGDINFQYVVGSPPGSKVKPEPFAAKTIAGGLEIPPERIFFVGDTTVDIQTGINAGMVPVGVLWGFRTKAELSGNGARIILSEPCELVEYLEDDIFFVNI